MFLELYNKYNYELADPRSNDFLLMTSPFKVLAILALYLWFCLKAGPHFMKDRKPFQLRKTLVVYNLIQIILSAIFFKEALMMWLYVYDLRCTPVDYSVNPKNTHLMFIGHIYFLSKISELLDTVFFVLRKKYSQITTLHLYHHTIMVVICWVILKYMAAGLGPMFKKYLTWKKQITQLQLVQFVIILIYNLQALPRELFKNNACTSNCGKFNFYIHVFIVLCQGL
nr:elongation of very long chain fatty acids protein 7-like isoform X2 [Onthophagus taurus]